MECCPPANNLLYGEAVFRADKQLLLGLCNVGDCFRVYLYGTWCYKQVATIAFVRKGCSGLRTMVTRTLFLQLCMCNIFFLHLFVCRWPQCANKRVPTAYAHTPHCLLPFAPHPLHVLLSLYSINPSFLPQHSFTNSNPHSPRESDSTVTSFPVYHPAVLNTD